MKKEGKPYLFTHKTSLKSDIALNLLFFLYDDANNKDSKYV